MNVYQACQKLQIWIAVRAYIEIWKGTNNHDYNKIKILAKKSYKELACVFHPDMPTADNNIFLEIKEALDIINNSTINQLFIALDNEIKNNIKYFDLGSDECKECVRWSKLLNNCVFATCQGFKLSGFSKVKSPTDKIMSL